MMTTFENDWSWLDAIGSLRRRRLQIVVVTLLSAGLSAGAALIVPRTYEALTTIRIGRAGDRILEDPAHVAAWVNSASFAPRLQGQGFPQIRVDELLTNVKATVAEGPSAAPFVTIGVRRTDQLEAIRLASTAAQIVIEEHRKRYDQFLRRQQDYREKLRVQIEVVKSEIAAVDGLLKEFRQRPTVDAPAVLLMRAQLEEKQSQVVAFERELRDVDVGILAFSEETRAIGEPVTPRSRLRPRRTLITLAGTAAGGLLAVFWALALEARPRKEAPQAAV